MFHYILPHYRWAMEVFLAAELVVSAVMALTWRRGQRLQAVGMGIALVGLIGCDTLLLFPYFLSHAPTMNIVQERLQYMKWTAVAITALIYSGGALMLFDAVASRRRKRRKPSIAVPQYSAPEVWPPSPAPSSTSVENR
jgi:hypothetical protein